MHATATAGVDGVLVEVFLDQDAEGPFAVWARYDGVDAFELDRRVGDERELFVVVWDEEGCWVPEVPARPGGWSREQLQETVLGVVAEWLAPLVPVGATGLRWEVGTPDGATDPIPIAPAPT